MGYKARFIKGTIFIDLTNDRNKLAADFVPPTTSITPLIGMGGQKIGETAEPRAWGFGVLVSGSSSAEVKRGTDDLANFLRQAGDESEPLYFEWREDNNVSFDPVWGQFGAARRLEVVSGDVGYWESYATGSIKDRAAFVPIHLTIKPWALGARQLLATASGGICEDWIGTTDGRSRGLQIPEADATNGNRFTNPVFGHATWNTGWTAAGNVTASKNTDPQFVLHGLNSAKLTCAATTLKTWTQSIAAGDTNPHILSCYARLPDGGVISATHCYLFYDSELATTYTAVGNGWYRLSAAVAGKVAATLTGISVNSTYTVYVTAFQFEERAYITPFFYGDMLGGAWASTPHESKSTRTASRLFLPISVLGGDTGTIRIVWKADRSNTTYPGSSFLLYSSSGFSLSYEGTIDSWYFNLATGGPTAADTFVAGDSIVFHITWSPSGCVLYVNGVGTTASYAVPVLGSYLYIGTDASFANNIGGMISGLSIYQHQFTAAEALADYTNIAPLVADGQSVDPIPYIWTKDGDNVVDYIDSGAYRNIATVGGVVGDAPAKTEFKAVTAGLNSADVYIGLLDLEYSHHVDPEFLSNVPGSPPEVIDATNVDILLTSMTIDDDEFRILAGRRLAIMLRADDAGNNIIIKTGVQPGGALYYSSQLATSWTIGSITNDMTPEIYFPADDLLYRELGITRLSYVNATGKRTAAGALHFHMYSSQIMPFPMLRFVNISAVAAAATILYLGNGQAREVNAAALSYIYTVIGDKKEWGIVPGRYNWLISYLGKETIATDSSDTLTYSAIYITPRWLIA